MAKLKRDERVCPFCGENIKAVAIRCRFCQSDVIPLVQPDSTPEPATPPAAANKAPAKKAPAKKAPAKPVAASAASATQTKKPPAPAEPAPVVTEPADATSPAASRLAGAGNFLRTQLTAVLAVLVVLAAVGVGTLWWHTEHSTSATASHGVLVDEDARTQVLISAADLTQRTLSYNYKTLANDMEVARARMTPSFRKQYDSTMAQIRDNTTKNKIVLQASTVSSAIISATQHKAKVLVFVNQTTSAGTGKKQDQQLTRNSLVVTLTRGDGDWDMSKLTALG